MPLLLLALFLFELLTWAVIGIDIYLFREWYQWRDVVDDDYARQCLCWALGLLAYLFLGKFPIAMLLCKSRKGEDEPKAERAGHPQQLKRPDGSEIHIEEMGNPAGKPLLFVHGWNANSMEWYYQKKHFVDRGYRIILMDLPGLGLSKRPDNKNFSLQKMASDLEAVIHHLDLKGAVLWGHSAGGMTILTYCTEIARDLHQRVSGIILQHTTYTDPTKTSILSKLLHSIKVPVLYPFCWLMILLSPLFWVSKWMSYMNGNLHLSTRFLTFAGTQTFKQLDFIARLSAMAPPSVFARGMLGMMKTYDVSRKLERVDIPTLIFSANRDKLTKPVASDYMETHIRKASQVRLAPAGHQGLVERHGETNEAAQRFLEGLIA